jgi:hypothetical protein
VASLVCGIIAPIGGFLCGVLGLLSIPAVILGHMALHEIKHDTVRQDGRGLAIGGLALGYATLAIGLVFVAIFALFLATPTE